MSQMSISTKQKQTQRYRGGGERIGNLGLTSQSYYKWDG